MASPRLAPLKHEPAREALAGGRDECIAKGGSELRDTDVLPIEIYLGPPQPDELPDAEAGAQEERPERP